MFPYIHGSRVLELKRLRRAIQRVDDEAKAERNREEMAVSSMIHGSDASPELTLDDFGGRSDALGG
jgi:hypothetical protein